ncbi:hypothetical protein QMG83_05195 [Salinibacterium sp. G-O1]|uniref:hypothetical protein n=1 Tax=Salinibacterium sp. G-O1 TaxID=3046208 RepID=UPI0024B9BCA5|nr:hypothetical protein [Salinibacterium sp. G-O1]MDJ0334613.1 hypothetical protein [Salinibacterium sp. G-O1]
MTYSPPEENTLGVILGRGKRREADATRRVIRAATPLRSSLGIGFIGVGAIVVCGLLTIYCLIWLVALWDSYPDPLIALAAWVVLIGVLIATIIVSRAVVGELPNWMFALFVAGLSVTIALDFYAIWPLNDIGHYATASVAAGVALVSVVVTRRASDILVTAGFIGAAFIVCILLNTSLTPANLAPQVTTLALTVVPALIAVVLVRGFRRLVQVELDRVLVQSTVSAPRFAVGMMASEELARLDLAAEELLDSVSTGRTKLPLDPRTASVAASLATELRLHLIEGRRETWLYHAITESDLLGKTVTLADKGSLAGLLDPQQRDGLLSSVWLLINDAAKSATRSVQIAVGPVTQSVETGYGRKITIPITLTITGVSRNKVDPATWEALGKIGQYSDSTQNSTLRVEIACLVDNPADQ